uniref:cysteine desulfurase n=1 Tax=Stygiella incarcerata TaxID=1712417 RepID=A0A192ZIK9_9EUKA|nr:IscS [Stygiella incarcerata]|eukprot:TRINITY_DN1056_c0_g1_i3.p1 TRINITY_DN1056_c0_g1~~TRINITY_DN1056_c0_g1_i3.p1  ORF type:complete len:441 (+),score=120.59 TRINITY_DN1056_c0_g1_i3:150-1472(+)
MLSYLRGSLLPGSRRAIFASSMLRFLSERLEKDDSFPNASSIYLDFQATTPMDPRVLDKMLPFLTHKYGNPHSRSHAFGWEAERYVEEARTEIAGLIGADAKEVIFTSGATESNNTALKGVASFYGGKKKHIITTQIEHKCVLDSCRHLSTQGFEVTYLPVKKDGLVDLNVFAAAIRPDTLVASVMTVNNEIGVIQDIPAIGKICKEKGVLFHTDAAQALGKIDLDVNKWNVDLMSLSGHKIYGPKGIGALFVRRRRPRVRLQALINGGGQERGMRSGTLPAPLCIGFGEACRIAKREMPRDHAHIQRLQKRLLNGLSEKIPQIEVNGSLEHRYVGNLNVSFSCVEGESLLMALKEVAVSSGSACTSASLEPSYVLRALGVNEELAHTSLRFGIGRFTTEEEIDRVIDILATQVERLRDLSPLWEILVDGSGDTVEWNTK